VQEALLSDDPSESVSTIPAADWPALHRCALARGCGGVLHLEDGRLAARE
jgi:hypothetical protein